MTVTFPPKITASQLKQIARLCGKSRAGTKAAISGRIVDDLQGFKPLAPGTRVLSIDLGIRNLAYSLLEVPKTSRETSHTKAKRRKEKDASHPALVTPILHAWECLALIPKTPKPTKPRKKRSSKKKGVQEEDAVQDEAATVVTDLAADPSTASTAPVPTEDFSPTRLAHIAVDLIMNRLLPLKPDIITLEQQRFRSMGGSAIFEWTLRVNSLEAMLYAVFTTLRTLGQWPHGKLEPVVARNVLEFMVVQEGGSDVRDIWEKRSKNDNKKLKKDVVGRMLSKGEGVLLKGDVALDPVVGEYMEKWNAKGKRGKAATPESVKKLDDLADCLLQGMAFIRWQENKKRLLEGGLEALEDQMVEE